MRKESREITGFFFSPIERSCTKRYETPRWAPRRLDLVPPAGAGVDGLVSVAFKPWRRGGSRLLSVGGLRPLF
jgi:hypothetical protein